MEPLTSSDDFGWLHTREPLKVMGYSHDGDRWKLENSGGTQGRPQSAREWLYSADQDPARCPASNIPEVWGRSWGPCWTTMSSWEFCKRSARSALTKRVRWGWLIEIIGGSNIVFVTLHACMHACVCTYVRTCIRTYVHAYIRRSVDP